MSNIAYVSYKIPSSVQSLNPYWQQLTQWNSSVNYAVDTLTVELSGTHPSGIAPNQWGGVVGLAPISMDISSIAVQVAPGNAANSSDAVWAGIQLATAQPVLALSNGDPTVNACYPLVQFSVNQGNLWFGTVDTGGTTVIGSATYDPVNHKHLRLIGYGGFGGGSATISSQYSPDGINWTSFYSGGPAATGVFWYPELLTYCATSIASTASFSNYTYGYMPSSVNTVNWPDPIGIHIPMTVNSAAAAAQAVTVTAIVLDGANTVVASTNDGLPEITVPFNYGDTATVIQTYVTEALRATTGDYTLQVTFV